MLSIIDYQMGNLRSVQKAFEHLGHRAQFVNSPEQIESASQLVLPGVGAFKDAMNLLRDKSLDEAIRSAVQKGTPLMGICLGLQLLFESSSEGGEYPGLGLVEGHVRKFELDGEFKVPHMGWNQVRVSAVDSVFAEIEDGEWFYFVHSYIAEPADAELTTLSAEYGYEFCAAIQNNNIWACQFHPEKSQKAGLGILERFVAL